MNHRYRRIRAARIHIQLTDLKSFSSRASSQRTRMQVDSRKHLSTSDPHNRHRERVSASDPSGNSSRNETTMRTTTVKIPPKVLAMATIKILAKGDVDTTVLLFDIHRSYGDNEMFVLWCHFASKFGLIGPALYRRYQELGGSICELLVYVLHRQLHEQEDPVLIAEGLVHIARIRERITW